MILHNQQLGDAWVRFVVYGACGWVPDALPRLQADERGFRGWTRI